MISNEHNGKVVEVKTKYKARYKGKLKICRGYVILENCKKWSNRWKRWSLPYKEVKLKMTIGPKVIRVIPELYVS